MEHPHQPKICPKPLAGVQPARVPHPRGCRARPLPPALPPTSQASRGRDRARHRRRNGRTGRRRSNRRGGPGRR
eukprot:scaffold11842_cov62-Isochrysis_galbana.AAC.1